ncbi:hypothetical protein [Legionella sainthelensi]|uniref:Uncharacterized protein n=1 Tax=Legionella sainthelensi TaxID=28087 RepID=A0A2H5FLQ6_9GAMM|nr:hypothetical protein [Legionella sainthelensi]AUH72479.1 hypothetical protein CAB17_10710 [Legionella sainthelensi]
MEVNDLYLQLITCHGERYTYIKEHWHCFKIIKYLIPELDNQAFIGAGVHPAPFHYVDVNCRCGDLWSLIHNEVKHIVFPKESDLTSIVEFLRLGGAEYGYPDYNA